MRPDTGTFLSTNERKAIDNSISLQCRVDGRALTDVRRIRCRFADNEPGCVTVRLGGTIVIAKATHDIVEPWSHRPAEGQLQVNLEVPSPDGSQQSQLDDDGLRAQRALERCFKESRCLDLESLCIVPGERVFLIRVTATVINNDGNVIDCASMAVVLALADYRRPDVSLVQGAVRVGENAPVPLNLNFYPLVQTFGLFDTDGKYVVADLSAKEEAVAKCRIVVAMSANKEICCLHTIGGLQSDRRSLIGCARLAGRRARCLAGLLDRALANRRLDTLDLLPTMLTTASDVEMPATADNGNNLMDDDGELASSASSSGSDMDIAQSPQPPSSLAALAHPSAMSALASTSAGGSANPYSVAIVGDGPVASPSASLSSSAAPDTAKQVEFGLRFIRNAMLQKSAAAAAPAAAAASASAAASAAASANPIGGQTAGYEAFRDDFDDEEEVTMVTQLY